MREFLIKKKHSRAFVSVLHLLLKPHSSCEAAVPEVDLVDLAAAGLVLVVSEEEASAESSKEGDTTKEKNGIKVTYLEGPNRTSRLRLTGV